MRFGAVPLSVPWPGVPALKVNAVSSGSDPVSVMAFAVSSAVVTLCALAVGGLFAYRARTFGWMCTAICPVGA